MCSIIGINGKYNLNDIKVMLDTLKHRGPDATGLYYNSNIYYNDEINNISSLHISDNLVLAHNLLSIVGSNECQPISSNNLVLISNAELYNYKELIDKYNIADLKTRSDCEIILKVIEYYYNNDLKSAVLNAIQNFDGDYAFCIYDYNNYMVVRDKVGVKPVYYSINGESLSFASEKKALNSDSIQSLNPRYAIYNNNLIRIHDDYVKSNKYTDYNKLKIFLKKSLIDSVYKRVQELDKVALLFSAGVDSTLIATILKQLNVNFTCYTVGTENSQDLNYAIKVADKMDFDLKYKILSRKDIEDNFVSTINTIEDTNLMKVGVGMTINLTSKIASDDNHKVILSGQGADELFAGYNRYKNKINTPELLQEELTHDLNNMYHVNLERDDKAVMSNSMELRVPFLDKSIIEIACGIPVNYLIKSEDDSLRKYVLRDVAYELGLPYDIAYRPKKAAQYGSGIDKIIKKKLRKDMRFSKYFSK